MTIEQDNVEPKHEKEFWAGRRVLVSDDGENWMNAIALEYKQGWYYPFHALGEDFRYVKYEDWAEDKWG